MPYYPTRRVTVIARDPSVQVGGPLSARPWRSQTRNCQAGPRGYRVQVVDFDSSTGILYKTLIDPPNRSDGPPPDPFERSSDEELLASPDFHALNCTPLSCARWRGSNSRSVGA